MDFKRAAVLCIFTLLASFCMQGQTTNNFLMAGATWNQDASPPFSGWGSFGKCVYHDTNSDTTPPSTGPCRVYSFTTWDVTFFQESVAAIAATATTAAVPEHLKWKAQYSQRTGGALVVHTMHGATADLALILLGDAGAAQTTDAIGASYSAGGGAVWSHKSGFLLTGMWRNLKTTNSNNPKDFRAGIGWRF